MPPSLPTVTHCYNNKISDHLNLVELGINETADTNNIVPEAQNNTNRAYKLAIYKNYFEKRFLEETRNFYATESADFIQSNNVTEYMKKVINLIP